MILTITANPSVDMSYQLDKFNIDGVTRTDKVIKHAGGKGIHVGYVLNDLGKKAVHSGFVGGKLGEFIEEGLEDKGQEARFIKVKEPTRNCLAILHEGKQTEILEAGPTISGSERDEFIEELDKISEDCSVISMSGSLPKGLDPSFYEEIIAYGKSHNKFVAVDTSGQTLKDVVNSDIKPDLIKPNETEVADLLGEEITKDNIKEALKKAPLKDIEYVIVSLGKDGAVVKVGDRIYKASVPEVKAINPVGSGDSSLAGAIFAIDQGKNPEDVIKTSMTCGLLNVLTEEIAHIEIEKFDKYYEEILVEEI
ncbi:1-phosphofructokinase family hexose kinase [uncultured Anaerococcus sp.]|uniref:1-phosphofructokinase family hexose kinase n=1 Tax=uncultured Anaerococcus sp. TaxID=293428 RepID=UPI0026002D6E|nr:hexose kinase [uncultured Anaerococcus sp.]